MPRSRSGSTSSAGRSMLTSSTVCRSGTSGSIIESASTVVVTRVRERRIRAATRRTSLSMRGWSLRIVLNQAGGGWAGRQVAIEGHGWGGPGARARGRGPGPKPRAGGRGHATARGTRRRGDRTAAGPGRRESLLHDGELAVSELLSVLPAVLDLPLDQLHDGGAEIDSLEPACGVEPARADRVDLDELVADDVDTGVEDAVGDEPGAHRLGDLENPRCDLGLRWFPPGCHVAAEVAFGVDASECCVFAVNDERLAVEQEEADVAVARGGQVLLRDDVARACE